LSAARTGNYELAVRYLNTRLTGKSAATHAQQLYTVLDRRLPARVVLPSDNPEDSLTNLLNPDKELVGTISSDHGDVDILLERVDRGNSGLVWLFSNETLELIPDLYEESNAVSVDNVLPGFLVNTRFAGVVLFEWLAVFVGMPLFYLFTVLLNRLLSPVIGLLRRRLYKKPDLPNPEFLPVPVRLLLLAAVIHWIVSEVSLPLLAREIANRLTHIFVRDESGRRPVHGGTEKFQTDPLWNDYILFYEYFHGDNGAGLGASHQTGWTGVVAGLIDFFGRVDGAQYLDAGKAGAFAKTAKTQV